MKYDLIIRGGLVVDGSGSQAADGYMATIVSGKAIARADKPTGVPPGRVVRGAQSSPA
jgi:N-acyl-D-aspartate/D-glutamate deacylase